MFYMSTVALRTDVSAKCSKIDVHILAELSERCYFYNSVHYLMSHNFVCILVMVMC